MFPGMPGWGGEAMGQAEKTKKKKKAKKKRKTSRGGGGSSSSSSSSSDSEAQDWRQMVWQQGWQPGMQGMPAWPPMGAPPPMFPPPGMPHAGPGGWPPAFPEGVEDPFGAWMDPGFNDGFDDMAPKGKGKGKKGKGKGKGGGGMAMDDDHLSSIQDKDEDVPIFLEPAVEELVPVPKQLLGKVIGKQAQTIIEIRERSGAFKVDARDQSSDPCMVKVAGTAEAVQKAKDIIKELMESARNKHVGSDYVEIPRAKIGMVIGLKGAQMNEIQLQTGTKIDVDFEADPCKCYIKGPPDNVDHAKKVLLTIAMQIEDGSSEYIDLPKSASGALIGVQGSRVREFQEQSGARIDVDKTGSRCRVRISGTSLQVAKAKQLIMQEVEHIIAQPRTLPPPPSEGFPVRREVVVPPPHQMTTFPTTLAESIARAKANAQAVKDGLNTHVPPPPPAPTLSGGSSDSGLYQVW